MFGLQFLFSAALWGLPLMGLPLLLHLLFRQKAPVVQFSTLRFIQASLRQTAARKRVQRWLLLACRALLLGLLIWALAQPALKPSASLSGGTSASVAAAVVVDTSYSMLLRDGQTTLLQKADAAVQDLLRTELRDADAAVLRDGSPPHLRPAADYRGDHWPALRPLPSPQPLIDRVNAAADLLANSGADRKWLIILTDAQQREFPRQLPATTNDLRTLLIDLHPPDVSSAAITELLTDPVQPRMGIPAQITIRLTGRPNDTREVRLTVKNVDGNQPQQPGKNANTPPLPIAHFDAAGHAELHTPLSFNQSSWLLITAELASTEPLQWAVSRSRLVHIPAPQPVAVLPIGRPNPLTLRIVRLALDPGEGRDSAWPVALLDGPPRWNESLVVALLNDWPDQNTTQQMQSFVRAGGTLMLFVQSGLESTWPALDPARQTALAELLPSPPRLSQQSAVYHGSIVKPDDPVLADLGDVHQSESRLVVTRLVQFVAADKNVHAIINAAPNDPDSGAKLTGLLWRRAVGSGQVLTWATLPDRTSGNLRVWDLFPPSLVNAARPPDSSNNLNIEIGQSLSIPAALAPAGAEVDLQSPGGGLTRVVPANDRYTFADASAPGLYAWQWRSAGGRSGTIAWVNVQLPAAEADLRYKPISAITNNSPQVLVAHSLEEARQRLAAMDAPRPQWTLPIALVLLLLCLEGLLGALPKFTLPWRVADNASKAL